MNDTDKGTAHTSESIAEAIRPTLDAFAHGAAPYIRKVTDELYEQLLNCAQDYVRENGEWNIGAEIERCRKIEVNNYELRKANAALLEALTEARAALHQHYVDWDGEPEDAVPLQLARARCDVALTLAKVTPE